MAHIIATDGIMTLVNIFQVDPGNADHLIGKLVEMTEVLKRERPGFISASIHRSDDGARVINYAQWRTREDFEAFRDDPASARHFEECAALAKSFDPIVCTVVFTDGK